MADVNEQIAQIKANATTFTNTAIRQVQGGFVVTGQVQYMDKSHGGVVLSENAEAVAHSDQSAAQMVLNYMRSGKFDTATAPDPAQGNMFATQTAAPSAI